MWATGATQLSTERCLDEGSVAEGDSQGTGKMLFLAAIKGSQVAQMSIVALRVVLHYCGSDELPRQQWTSPTSAFPPPYDGSPNKSFKCLSQVSLAQRMCGGAERGSVNQLALYTSPSLPNITLGLPATATATAASNVRRTTAALQPWVVSTILSIIPLFPR